MLNGLEKRIWRCLIPGFLVLATILVSVTACGGGSPSGQTSAQASRQFQDPEGTSGKEPVATFGAESGEVERDEASAALSTNLAARQEADFVHQCATLGKRGLESVLGPWKSAKDSARCPATLQKLAEPLSNTEEIRKDTLSGTIAALRVKGKQGYALYHGNDGKDYAMPMEVEGGTWKVGSITTVELPTGDSDAKSQQKG